MAICATVDGSGIVHAAANIPLNECSSFVLLDKSDWIGNGLVQGLTTIPAGEDFAALWAAGFIVPMTIGLIAWAVFKVVQMWR